MTTKEQIKRLEAQLLSLVARRIGLTYQSPLWRYYATKIEETKDKLGKLREKEARGE